MNHLIDVEEDYWFRIVSFSENCKKDFDSEGPYQFIRSPLKNEKTNPKYGEETKVKKSV